MTRRSDWAWALLGSVSVAAMAQTTDATLAEVTVQSGRLEQRQFDAPGSVQALDAQVIRTGLQVDRKSVV